MCDSFRTALTVRGIGGYNMKRAGFMFIFVTAFAAASLFLVQPLAAQATTDELSALRQKNAELEKKVNELEALLKERTEVGKEQFSDDQGYQNKKNWRSLEAGMNEEQVKKLLGDPLKVIKGVKILWYYPNIYAGYVSFDEKGRLTGWNEP
jgi:outer membrane protein assembly factor BamE (lipoprotein component of BamABCDE complex)